MMNTFVHRESVRSVDYLKKREIGKLDVIFILFYFLVSVPDVTLLSLLLDLGRCKGVNGEDGTNIFTYIKSFSSFFKLWDTFKIFNKDT